MTYWQHLIDNLRVVRHSLYDAAIHLIHGLYPVIEFDHQGEDQK